jgi:NAD(P)H-hydrate epimerase
MSVARMRQWENDSWGAGISAAAVIKNVGRILARRMLDLTRAGDSILLLAGRGHNGDDVRAARPHLRGRKVKLMDVSDPRMAARELLRTLSIGRPDWIVDGLFGIGLNRPLDADWKTLIDTVNQSGIPILAMDVPSGLNADTGEVEGAAIRAEITLTVGAPKRGLLTAPQSVGRLEVAPDIGLVAAPMEGNLQWTLPSDFADWPPRRPVEGNKGTFGHVNIIAGSLGYHGAAVLAAQGALRAQPGLVTVEPQESVYVPVASQLQAAMVRPWSPRASLPKNTSAILFGPGLAADKLPVSLKKQLNSLWREFAGPMLVDASGMDWLKQGDIPRKAVRVITPHPGEAGRLLGTTASAVQADRIGALRNLSRCFGHCYVVLKGSHTLVGRAEGDIFVNSSGNPVLAQGGSGDLLSGYLAGWLAQPAGQKNPLSTIRFAVWQHGAVADEVARQRRNGTIEDIQAELGSIRT